jgi:hypothetical protein
MTQHEPQLNEKALFPGPRGGEDARLEQGRAQRVEHAERPAAGEAYGSRDPVRDVLRIGILVVRDDVQPDAFM